MDKKRLIEPRRPPQPFSAGIGFSYLALLGVAGIAIRDYFMDPEAGIELYRCGEPRLRELYGDLVPETIWMHTPPISYGHLHALGAELVFPEGGEVFCPPFFDSLDTAIEHLRREPDPDFADCGWFPFFREYRERLQRAFPDRACSLYMKDEGPLTTAYLLRGQNVFFDAFDQPQRFTEFLGLATDSISAYRRRFRRMTGQSDAPPAHVGLADDAAAFFSPESWPDLVLPVLERFFDNENAQTRSAHIEGLRPAHLPFLDQLGLSSYDPSISPQLHPGLIRDGCRVPFGWRLGAQHLRDLTPERVRDFVLQAVADGADRVHTGLESEAGQAGVVAKISAFKAAGDEVQSMLQTGAEASDVRQAVSAEGRRYFWGQWPGYLGRAT